MLFEGAQGEIALYFDPDFALQNRGALDLGFGGIQRGGVAPFWQAARVDNAEHLSSTCTACQPPFTLTLDDSTSQIGKFLNTSSTFLLCYFPLP
ncbi:hypothetical protein Lpp70_13559 [Lacticaseibacillus paracasei subsp. paracasei Lpp70]|jgi:hypothetical protein|uniref:Uncharacterized protein n=1 Tax=Lacticaseibacillus paracasei subsp. paracasei Lpp7 TaxID=1256200 RepID=A0A8E0IDT5_LACPA|nr:hypothetical protein Lpp7_13582 [Lacticaseibacillus paracasei subsp. paracasei Lpp7]EPD04387.1 hypothetical protein Lpp70_13559 [Lacticaseibacillus paracasei subsp. paracasei Lpp70]